MYVNKNLKSTSKITLIYRNRTVNRNELSSVHTNQVFNQLTFHRNALSDFIPLPYCFFSNSSAISCFLLTVPISAIPRDSFSANRRSAASACNCRRVSGSMGFPTPLLPE
uniref:SJCHGC02766 protein n=1 Tax=Schistosoma japonicum TaxID=6182 RepID=Q5DAS2_SCHJA|nr:SJCHGC02766 protein [Schistosoma japonicum]